MLKGDEDYRVTPIAPNELRIQIFGCVNQYGQETELDFTLSTWNVMTLVERVVHGVRELSLLNKQNAEEGT
jgi:hypothetical protein